MEPLLGRFEWNFSCLEEMMTLNSISRIELMKCWRFPYIEFMQYMITIYNVHFHVFPRNEGRFFKSDLKCQFQCLSQSMVHRSSSTKPPLEILGSKVLLSVRSPTSETLAQSGWAKRNNMFPSMSLGWIKMMNVHHTFRGELKRIDGDLLPVPKVYSDL